MFNPLKWIIWCCFAIGVGSLVLAQSDDAALAANAHLVVAKRLIERSVVYEGMSLDALSKTAKDLEIALSELREVDRIYDGKIRDYEKELVQESGDLPDIIAQLIAIEAAPFPNFLAHPDGILAAAQSRLLFHEVMRNYQNQIDAQKGQLDALYEAAITRSRVENIAQDLLMQINALRQALVNNANNPERPQAHTALIESLHTLDKELNALQILPNDNLKNSEIAPLNLEEWQAPASGKIAVEGEGMRLMTSDYDIRSPLTGIVRLAQSFPQQGKILMIEPQYGYLVVLMGLDELEVEEGEQVQAGQVIGFFTTEEEKNDNTQSSASPLTSNSLYIELRKNTQPIAFEELQR